jgi:hypothetical protein
MTTETGGPAFPTAQVNINGVDEQDGISAFDGGMTLRDYFAAKAMQGMLATGDDYQDLLGDGWDWYAKASYAMADAMLKARQA